MPTLLGNAMSVLNDRQRFSDYLRAIDDEAVVGYHQDAFGCVVARYLMKELGLLRTARLSISTFMITLNDSASILQEDSWHSRFIAEIDRSNFVCGDYIYAKDAKFVYDNLFVTSNDIKNALEIEKFRAWVDSCSDDQTLGAARNSKMCPIATYLTNTLKPVSHGGIFIVGVISAAYRSMDFISHDMIFNGCQFGVVVPNWVSTFVTRVDHCGKDYVERTDVLSIIDSI